MRKTQKVKLWDMFCRAGTAELIIAAFSMLMSAVSLWGTVDLLVSYDVPLFTGLSIACCLGWTFASFLSCMNIYVTDRYVRLSKAILRLARKRTPKQD